MKRKTNLFNLEEENSLFLTFSNYTEYLTGNFLSTNTKMYPSSFLCFNLPFENEDSRLEFKKYLMKYYENKLTTLREYCVKNSYKTEDYITPLFYLFDTINKFFGSNITPVHCGDIVEQDYNGTYSDSICIINLNSGYIVEFNEDKKDISSEIYVDAEENLCGWELNQITELYGEELTPEYDTDDNKYYLGSELKDNYTILFTPRNINSNNNEIEFNCIVPLFDIKNIKEANLTDDQDTEYKRTNIPLGIWLSPESIKIAKSSGFAQSWSLVIGSKFSPLPYSSMNVIDDNNSFDESTVKDIAYLTYAELLAKHSELQNLYNDCLKLNDKLNDELTQIKSQLNSLLIQTNNDKVQEYVDNKILELQTEFNKKMKTIEEYIANLKWKYIN